MLDIPDSVTVVEVGPRDGLQSFDRWVDTETKIRIIDRLSEVGFPVIEITSFAHPRAVPHLRDAEEVVARIRRREGTIYRALVPNARGATRAVAAGGVDEMLGLITATNAYTMRNQNMTVAEAVPQAIEAFRIADRAGIAFVMAIGMAFWCPYEGLVPEETVEALIGEFRDAGMRHFYLAGSVGMEDPVHVNRLFRRLLRRWPDITLGYHVHNMSGAGLANSLAALDAGATRLEGAICGLGGGMTMPKTYGAVGNLASEDIVQMLNDMGVRTGIATAEVQAATREIAALLAITPRSHVGTAGTRADLLAEGRQHAAVPL